jgi:hypothetical protein
MSNVVVKPGRLTETDFKVEKANQRFDSVGHDVGSPLDRDGLVLQGIPKLQIEHMERTLPCPLPVFGQPFTRAGWRQTSAELRRRERKAQLPALSERYKAMRLLAAKMPDQASPWDAMVVADEFHRALKVFVFDGVARGFLRDACYKVMNREFIGRNVG